MIFRIGFFSDEDRRYDNDMKLTRISIRRSVRSTRHPKDKLQRPSSQRLMTAKTDVHVVSTLMETILHSTTHLDVANADGLAYDIKAGLTVGHPDTFRDGYGVLVQLGRLTVKVSNDIFNIPWQHIISVVSQLRVVS